MCSQNNSSLRGQAITLINDEPRWTNRKLVNQRRLIRLLKDQERRVIPTKVALNSSDANLTTRAEVKVNQVHHADDGRPFMNLNLDTPSPTCYHPNPDPPHMTSPPAYTMRPRTYPEKVGGDRVSWSKEWFTTCQPWTLRAQFNCEHTWPSPTDHVLKTTIGWPQRVYRQSPSHSMQARKQLILVGKDALTFPGPGTYDRSRSHNKILISSPKYSIQQGRRNGTLPLLPRDSFPGPGSYDPNVYKTSEKVRRPAFTISKAPRLIGMTQNCTF